MCLKSSVSSDHQKAYPWGKCFLKPFKIRYHECAITFYHQNVFGSFFRQDFLFPGTGRTSGNVLKDILVCQIKCST